MYIKDNDFGDVKIKYNKENNVLTADGLTITDVPEKFDFTDETEIVISNAWAIFKALHNTFGAVSLPYDKVKEKGFKYYYDLAE